MPRVIRVLLTSLLLSMTAHALAESPVQNQGWSKTKPKSGRYVETAQGFMVPYTATIPGSDIKFDMIPVPGGEFLVGSPPAEKGRKEHEGPQAKITIEPFWIGKYEVKWEEYHEFMDIYDAFKEFVMLRTILNSTKKDEVAIQRKRQLKELLEKYSELAVRVNGKKVDSVDAITAPTKLYEPDTTYQYGDEPKMPAVTMTQYAAKHYTKWLSKLTKVDYRLPREAEWEYACRAGTTTAYHFGDDPSKLGEYAWYYDNGEEQLHDVGQKKPNPWGLYDMHGNVAEWVLDALTEDGYARLKGKQVDSAAAVAWPTKLFPRVVRGGHWDADADECRSASRMGSNDENWRSEDPNLPLSPWWFTTEPSHGVGMRIVRPLKSMSATEKKKVWELDVDELRTDVQIRLEEGRGAEDDVNAHLPKAVQQLLEVKKILKLEDN